ncbi:hypothetical protein H0H92_007151 [Tricholoma furcatifolium]|nr:hypothetical protein H0H92_007151 [Tricholoma furcatifolium]
MTTSIASQGASSEQPTTTSTNLSSSNVAGQANEASDEEELPRGISDDEGENVERRALVEEAKPQRRGVVGSKVASLAAVVSTTSVAEFVPPSTKGLRRVSNGLRKSDIRLKHLPLNVRNNWDSKFSPRIIEFIGTLKPWAALSTHDKQIIFNIWADVFPTEPPLEDDSSLLFIVMKLINDVTGAWQHKFSATAEKFLTETIFRDLEDDREVRAMWCTWALGTDMSAEQRAEQPQGSLRFYYGRYEEPGEEDVGGRIHASGIFQSPIIAATMATHYAWLDKLDSSYQRLEAPPIGALVLTIQAWLTGSKVKPPGQLANFAASNWADRKDRDGPFNVIDARLTSDILDVVDQINQKKWDSISKAAREYVRTSMKSKGDQESPSTEEPRLKRTFKLIDDDDSDTSHDGDDTSNHRTTRTPSQSFKAHKNRISNYQRDRPASSLSSSGSGSLNFEAQAGSGDSDDRSHGDQWAGHAEYKSSAAAAAATGAEAGMSSEPEGDLEEELREPQEPSEAE